MQRKLKSDIPKQNKTPWWVKDIFNADFQQLHFFYYLLDGHMSAFNENTRTVPDIHLSDTDTDNFIFNIYQ